MNRQLRTVLAILNITASGVFFGVLQWSAFFLLQSYVASTVIVYLLATTVWLCGSILGLLLPGRRGEALWLLGAVVAYYLLRGVAVENPYDLHWLPLLLVCVTVMGVYTGRFFRYRRGTLSNLKWLFFIENTGFVAGMVLTFISLFLAGYSFLTLAPGLTAVVCLATAVPIRALPMIDHPRKVTVR